MNKLEKRRFDLMRPETFVHVIDVKKKTKFKKKERNSFGRRRSMQ